jgi:HEPN domain-containing protein
MKQTAVEWMVEKLFKPMDNPPIENVSDIIEQAKEMEKQQIIDAYDSKVIETLANEYYNENYEI